MATDFAKSIEEYWLKISVEYKEKLAHIRLWKHLRVAMDHDTIWVRGILPQEIHSEEIKKIPFKDLYYVQDGHLIKIGNHLPEQRIKIGWMWSPITQIFKVEFPAYNHNLFQVEGTIKTELIPSDCMEKSVAVFVKKDIFETYVLQAPNIRLQALQWVIIQNFVLVVGQPLLPIPGKTFWQKSNFLLPAGFDFSYGNFSVYLEEKINPKGENWILFTDEKSFISIPKQDVQPLSRSSVRKSMA